MIKKLRIRMIVASIAAFALVILLISVLVNVVNYRTVTRQADETLHSIFEFESRRFDKNEIEAHEFEENQNQKPPFPAFMGKENPEAEYITRFFVVKYDDEGKITDIFSDNIAAASRDNTEAIAAKVLNKKSNSGYIEEYRYLKGRGEDGNIAVFLNVMQDQQHLISLRIITILISIASLFIVSILVIIFSKRAIKPIVDNIERQKQFITDASHELKTPITSIATSLDVISMEYEEDEWTENIKNQCDRMTKLVGELVTLSRLDEEKPIYKKENFSLSDLCWEILEIYQSRAKGNGRMIKAEIEDNISMDGDKSAIGQMISVLLDNAIKYAKGEGETAFKVKRGRNKIKIEVSNPTDYKEEIDVNRLFDRFYRPDSSRNTDSGGSGIGLAIAQAVVDAHGGKITAKCPDGKMMKIEVRL